VAVIAHAVDLIDQIIDGLGFCLSEEGDLLSQWRGYAADATGVAVGFHSAYLEWLSETSRWGKRSGFNLKKVEYDVQAHDALVAPTYAEVKRLIESGAFTPPGRRSLLGDARTDEEIERDDKIIQRTNMLASLTIFTIVAQLFLLKSPAFREEREWRLISFLVKGTSDECSYRSVDNQVVPYREYEFREIDRCPIAEVILGPKHLSPVQAVRDFLKQNGFGDVKVVRSSATYR